MADNQSNIKFRELRKRIGRMTVDVSTNSRLDPDTAEVYKRALDLVEKGDFQSARDILLNVDEPVDKARGYTCAEFLYFLLDEGMYEEADRLRPDINDIKYAPIIHLGSKIAYFLGRPDVEEICLSNLDIYRQMKAQADQSDEELMKHFDRAIASEYQWLGVVRIRKNDPEGVLDAYTKSYQTCKFATTAYNIAVHYARYKMYEECRTWFTRLVKEHNIAENKYLMNKWATDAALKNVKNLDWFKQLYAEASGLI